MARKESVRAIYSPMLSFQKGLFSQCEERARFLAIRS